MDEPVTTTMVDLEGELISNILRLIPDLARPRSVCVREPAVSIPGKPAAGERPAGHPAPHDHRDGVRALHRSDGAGEPNPAAGNFESRPARDSGARPGVADASHRQLPLQPQLSEG